MNDAGEGATAFGISTGLAFVGGYADASSFLLAGTFTGHLTGNCVLAAVSVASKDWYLTLDRLLAVIVFLGGVLFSSMLTRVIPVRLRQYSLAIAMLIEVLFFLGGALLLANGSNQELFIACMCLALGLQNGALSKTDGISVHSTYMTGMVTTLTQKTFDQFFSKQSPKKDYSKTSVGRSIQVLAPMWLSFIFGAVAGALIISAFHSIGLLGIILPLILLVCAEMRTKLSIGRNEEAHP